MIEPRLYLEAFNETLYMTLISTLLVAFFGLLLGILLYLTSASGLRPHKTLYAVLSVLTSVGRSIPFLILIVLLLPFTRFIVGTILGPSAAIPALVVGATPFYARLVELALLDKGKDLKETGLAFGTKAHTIVTRILLPESLPALLRGITVTAIAITGYTSIAGAIGAGGLGNLAYLYGFARNRQQVTVIATILMVALILVIQLVGDLSVKKFTHK